MSILLFYPFVSIDILSYPFLYPCISDILSIYILQFILSYPLTSYHILFCIHLNLLSYPVLSFYLSFCIHEYPDISLAENLIQLSAGPARRGMQLDKTFACMSCTTKG